MDKYFNRQFNFTTLLIYFRIFVLNLQFNIYTFVSLHKLFPMIISIKCFIVV